ncbi:acyltransferase family protein [Microbulbifer mangrovi]|uniref:acyltransferase family protein n=1 Tax=Microbulbifer mangrovi TaxID=927787 RepID=UPI00099079C1|nr:acyltransferase [Microbulbifer mangrovi]
MRKEKICLSGALKGRDNNLNLIRFCAATMVLVAHSFTIVTGDAFLEPFSSSIHKSIGSIAVDIFFFISGMLITSSLIHSPDYTRYAISRVLRIFPALFVANIITVLLLGPILTNRSFFEYLEEGSWLTYIIKNTSLFLGIQYQLSDLFDFAPYSSVVNGSLWTLPYELKMYCSIALLFAICSYMEFRERERTLVYLVAIISVASFFYLLADIFLPDTAVPYWKGGRLVFMFFVGALVFLCRDKIVLSSRTFSISIVALLLSLSVSELFLSVYLIVIPYIILVIAYVPKGKLIYFNKLGDFSYGLYIFAFPVQQTLIFLWPGISIAEMVMGSFFFTLIMAILSWHLVEKPCLSKRNLFYGLIKKRVFKRNAPSW